MGGMLFPLCLVVLIYCIYDWRNIIDPHSKKTEIIDKSLDLRFHEWHDIGTDWNQVLSEMLTTNDLCSVAFDVPTDNRLWAACIHDLLKGCFVEGHGVTRIHMNSPSDIEQEAEEITWDPNLQTLIERVLGFGVAPHTSNTGPYVMVDVVSSSSGALLKGNDYVVNIDLEHLINPYASRESTKNILISVFAMIEQRAVLGDTYNGVTFVLTFNKNGGLSSFLEESRYVLPRHASFLVGTTHKWECANPSSSYVIGGK